MQCSPLISPVRAQTGIGEWPQAPGPRAAARQNFPYIWRISWSSFRRPGVGRGECFAEMPVVIGDQRDARDKNDVEDDFLNPAHVVVFNCCARPIKSASIPRAMGRFSPLPLDGVAVRGHPRRHGDFQDNCTTRQQVVAVHEADRPATHRQPKSKYPWPGSAKLSIAVWAIAISSNCHDLRRNEKSQMEELRR